MAIILNDFVEIETTPLDLTQSLMMQKGTSFFLDFDGLNIDIDQTEFPTFLIPLDVGFQCPRTLIYNNDKKVQINSKFGLFDYDFLDIEIPHIYIMGKKYTEHGVIISKHNPYFDIFNEFAKKFKCVEPNNKESLILTNKELMKFALIPFELTPNTNEDTGENGFSVKISEDKLSYDDHEKFLDAMIDDITYL